MIYICAGNDNNLPVGDLRMRTMNHTNGLGVSQRSLTGFLSFFTGRPEDATHVIHGRPQGYPQL